MKNLPNEDIDKIFRDKFHHLEREPLEEEWTSLAKDLKRHNFLSFGWKHFNIYLLLATTVILAGIVYIIGHRATTSPIKEKPIDSVSNHSLIIDSANKQKRENPPISVETKIKKTSTSRKKEENKNQIIIPDSSTSVIQVKEEPVIIQEVPKTVTTVPKQKKIITIMKKDTLVVTDTISVKKKRRRDK